MPASTAPNIGLNYGWSVGENGWGAGQSYNLFVSDWFMQPRILDKDLATPPASPVLGDAYIVATSPTGAWAGKAGQIAIYYASAWYFFPPKSGWRVYVVDEALTYQYSGSAWASTIAVTTLTVGATALVVNAAARVLVGTASDDGVNKFQVAGSISIATGNTYKVNNVQVVAARVTGWGTPSGTLDRTALAAYAGATMSAGYVQAEAQATNDAVKKASQVLAALITDLRAHGLIGT